MTNERQPSAGGMPGLPSVLQVPSRESARRAPLCSQRLHLSPIEPSDGAALWGAIDSCRDYLERWLPWVPYSSTREATNRFAAACAADWDAGRALRFIVRDRQSHELLGVVGLDTCIHLHRSCDLGYWLRKDATGHGLMTEAARLTMDFAFGPLFAHRVRCAAATDNHPSLRVIARLGFRLEGIARQAEHVGGRWVDHAIFSRLETDD